MKKLFAFLLSLFILFNTTILKPQAVISPPPTLSAESAVLIDLDSKAILFEHGSDRRLGMASTTKIMTALIAAERSDINQRVKIPDEAIGVEGSSIYLQNGETLTMEELLFALLLQSANDAATAIAIAVAGSIGAFADMMNERALQMGLKNTHFTNPHGLYDEEHYTTAYDLAVISAHALKNETIAKIFSTYKATIPIDSTCTKRVLVNHNKLLRIYKGAIGVKTGFTKKTGRCLVSAATRDGLSLVAVTLNAPDDWNDHMKMLDYGFENFESFTVAKAGAFNYSVSAVGGKTDRVTLTNATELRMTLPKSRTELSCKIETFHRLEFAPILKGTELGKISYFYGDSFYTESVLICAKDFHKASKDSSLFKKFLSLFS